MHAPERAFNSGMSWSHRPVMKRDLRPSPIPPAEATRSYSYGLTCLLWSGQKTVRLAEGMFGNAGTASQLCGHLIGPERTCRLKATRSASAAAREDDALGSLSDQRPEDPPVAIGQGDGLHYPSRQDVIR